MLRYRAFQNTDPPIVASIWRSRMGRPGLMQPVSVDTLEQLVFGKLYFDYQGLVLAFEGDDPVGFVHAGFAPTAQGDRLDRESGVICMLMTRPDCAADEVASGLLHESEKYLRRRGARSALGGDVQTLTPFYVGLYGGHTLPGVLESDADAAAFFRGQGYTEVGQMLGFAIDLETFRAPIDRQQLQYRRQMIVEAKPDCPTRSWWEACTTGDFELTRFDVSPRGVSAVQATALFREVEPAGALRPGRTVELIDAFVQPPHRRQGLGTFLLAEAFRQLALQGVGTVEAPISRQNTAGLALFRKLGLNQVDQAGIFRKEIDGQ